MSILIPIILAGGAGKRLWPLSTEVFPKQFHSLLHPESLLQTTLLRFQNFADTGDPIIVTHTQYRFIVAEQLRQLDLKATILLEKTSHNTTAAVTLAALFALSQHDDPILLICPSDHLIDDAQFYQFIQSRISLAKQGKLVTFGVPPTHPSTQYGYIQKGALISQDPQVYAVDQFIEKPPETKAKKMVASEQYFWNSGIFLMQASVLIKELEQFAPDILSTCRLMVEHSEVNRDFVHCEDRLEQCSNLSIDRIIFEKTQRAVVSPFQGVWQDLGNWNTLYAVSQKDSMGNVQDDHVISIRTENSYLHSTKPLLVTCGIKNCCVVVTEDAVLVADLSQPIDFEKELAQYLGREE